MIGECIMWQVVIGMDGVLIKILMKQNGEAAEDARKKLDELYKIESFVVQIGG